MASFKWTYELSGKDYRVPTLPKLYLIVIGIIMQSLKSIEHANLFKLTKRANVPDGRSLIIGKLRF